MLEWGENTTATPKSKAAQLRAELRRLWGLVDILIKALAGTLGAAGKMADAFSEEVARLEEEVGALKEENRDLERRVKMRESWNHSSSEATGYAKDRRKFRREAKMYRAGERGEDPDAAVPKRSPGHQPGEPGVSHHDKPGGNRKSFVADMCPQCGRTDLKPPNKIQKLIREIVGLARVLSVFLYSITPGMCPDCGIRVLPHTGQAIRRVFWNVWIIPRVRLQQEAKGTTRLCREIPQV